MKIKSQFSKNSLSYDRYNLIQKQAIQKLLNDIHSKPGSILDLGCGTGSLYRAINWPIEQFTGVDFSAEMLLQHPQAAHITCKLADFDDAALFDSLKQSSFERIFSASSLQWATDLNATFKHIKQLNTPVAFAIFTANTFNTLFETAKIPPILRSAEEVSLLARQYFNATYETVHYTLKFNNTLDMLRYIKRSGVSSTRNILDYKSIQRLIRDYPLDYLEFELLFIIE